MSHVAYGNTAGHGSASLKGISSVFTRASEWLVRRSQLRSAEHYLSAMDDRLLSDIGLSRGDIHDVVWGKRHDG
jgi:uncharacterized protein YjiS (DUF1127 family)